MSPGRSQITHINSSCPPYKCVMSHIGMRHFSHEWVVSVLRFVSTNMGLDFSVLFKPITRLVKSSSEFADYLQRNSTSLQHLAYQDRAICGSLLRYFRIKLGRSTDRHNPHVCMRHDLEKNGSVFAEKMWSHGLLYWSIRSSLEKRKRVIKLNCVR